MPTILLGKRSVFSVRGADAVRYLNGQVTQDVRLLLQAPKRALATCITDAKGKLQAYATMYLMDADVPEIRIEAPLCLRENLLGRLSRYLIADDAEIEDHSDEWILVHATSEEMSDAGYQFSRYGIDGQDRWLAVGEELPKVLGSEADMELTRIAHTVPLWGAELEEGMLPPEAGLEQQAISYHKGCYIGQEVISRIKSAGKVNRLLKKFQLESIDACVGATLLSEGVELGPLTSVAFPHALGYLSKKGIGQTEFDLRLPDGRLLIAAARCDS